jgi:hypothetical protein
MHTIDSIPSIPQCIAKHGPRQPTAAVRTIDGPEGPQPIAVIAVPLPDGRECVIEREAYARIMAQGYTDQWFCSSNGKEGRSYVCTSHEGAPARPVKVHHLVVERQGQGHIGFVDGDPLNLLRGNLGRVTRRYGRAERPGGLPGKPNGC